MRASRNEAPHSSTLTDPRADARRPLVRDARRSVVLDSANARDVEHTLRRSCREVILARSTAPTHAAVIRSWRARTRWAVHRSV